MTEPVTISPIRNEDNEAIANVIRTVMKEFNADPETTIIGDPTLNTMYQNYLEPKSIYFVLLDQKKVVGGCGIKKLDFAHDNICELQRMFILPAYRGNKLGLELMKDWEIPDIQVVILVWYSSFEFPFCLNAYCHECTND